MKEILFRGKRVDNGEWVYGCFEKLCIELENGKEITYHYIQGLTINDGYMINPETVGQFTGLTDKNGKNVFEGDILKDEYGRIILVIWREKFAKFAFKLIKSTGENWTKNFSYADMWSWFDLENNLPEVIGNIYDNPELLEEKK